MDSYLVKSGSPYFSSSLITQPITIETKHSNLQTLPTDSHRLTSNYEPGNDVGIQVEEVECMFISHHPVVEDGVVLQNIKFYNSSDTAVCPSRVYQGLLP
jgi:hypothetical protein